ncbi:hypothetical protein BX661DRAFT_173573 [Kickxella alabastrina]|uniref:uncharacterized protein n=1 Tax=Kickxella alabastrina TaxID=61397 RepID=UPI00222075A1|nr:uncharacterized protein BX661DRAFT_173573 [Kickxella alabastrina]KAI7820603.1 hypothetical protein BX661DRAFT_173573 [Kickxella alabastrina]KAJ1934498.1 hypothetical protein GGF37_006343 [Kickxella alabastrina]
MGQSASKAALTKNMRLPRTPVHTQQPAGAAKPTIEPGTSTDSTGSTNSTVNRPVSMPTREQILAEDAQEQQEHEQLSSNLKRFLNPKELLTTITPANPNENTNVQTLRSRREDDDIEVAAGTRNRITAVQVAGLLRELRPSGGELPTAAATLLAEKYSVDLDTLRRLDEFLIPLPKER